MSRKSFSGLMATAMVLRAVVGRNAGRDALLRLDGDGERGRVPRLVRARHALKVQRVGPLRRNGEADQAAPEAGHEIDGVRRRHLRRNDEIALVLALLGVHENEHAALARVFQDLVDGRELLMDLRFVEHAYLIGLHFVYSLLPEQPCHVTGDQVHFQVRGDRPASSRPRW